MRTLIVALPFSWSSVRFFGTVWSHTQHMFKSCSILWHMPCDITTFPATASTVSRRSLQTISQTWTMVSSLHTATGVPSMFILLQCVLPCFELSIPLVHARLGHAFLVADILHHPSCLSSSFAQFNTKSDIWSLFTLWHLAKQQCILIYVAFSLSYISYCIIILDRQPHAILVLKYV
jgi:hypothetical protein